MTKQITTGKPTDGYKSTLRPDFTIEYGLRPLLQDKDPHIDELNEDQEDRMSECEECGCLQELGTFNVAESKTHGTQHAFCDDCFAKYIERSEIRKVWGEEEWELLDQNDDDYTDEEAEGDHQEIYDICEWCRGVMDEEYPRSDRPLLLEQNYDDFLATPQDCPRCEYERQTILQYQDKDELNAAIDASGNCFN